MSKFDLPELPSDDELGITDEDREFLKEVGDDGPEMSDAEMRALLGDAPAPAAASQKPAKPDKKAARAAKKAAKAAKKAAREAEKEEKRKAKAAGKEGTPASPARPESDSERAARVARSLGAASRGEGAGKGDTGARGGGTGGDDGSGPPPKAEKPTGPAEPMAARSRWRGPATLVALLVVSVVSSSRTGLPRPVPANAPDTVFSSSRAVSSLIEIARAPRPTGSPEHTRVREYLVERLRSLGLEPQVQTATTLVQSADRPEIVTSATLRNVLARIPGTRSTGAVLMTAHYDGRGVSLAASDDGVGVVTIIEAVRALLAGGPVANDIIILLTDGEELGLLGARAFVGQHPWLEDVSLVLSFEMRGGGGPAIMFQTADMNGWVVRALHDFDPHPFANSMSMAVLPYLPNDTDFTPFREAGKQGLNFAAIDRAHVYHQAYDTPQALDESTLQHHGIQALAAARYFGDADLESVFEPDVVYFTVPFVGLIVYDRVWVLAVSGALLLLLVGSFLLARRAGARPARMAMGLGVSVATAGVAFGAAYALVRWLPRFHPEAGSLHGSLFHEEGWYMIAVASLAFAAVTGVYGLARRWLSATELGVGAVALPALAALGLGFFAPLAAMNLQWPVLAALASLAVLALLGARSDAPVGWVVGLLLTLPVLVMLEPVTELLWLALTIRMAPALAVLAALTLWLCVPAIEALRHPNSWWAPATGVVVAAASVGLGILTSRPSAERPSPSTLVYAYEHGTGAAVWATDPGADSLDSEAVAWAVQRAGGTFGGTRDLSGFAYPPGQLPTTPAPVIAAQPPEVIVARDSIDGGTRRVTLRVRSRIGAELLAFMYDAVGDTRLLSINGKAITSPERLRVAYHHGVPEPAVVLELEMPADQAIGLHVIEHLLRPAELLGDAAFARPARLAPDITRWSDRAMFRYSVGAFADPRHKILLPGAAPGATGAGGAPPADSGATGAGAGAPPAGQPADTGAARAGAPPPDTGAVAAGAPTDTLRARRDTAQVAPGPPTDTLRARRDTAQVAPGPPTDTLGARRDTAQGAGPVGDTLGADTIAGRRGGPAMAGVGRDRGSGW